MIGVTRQFYPTGLAYPITMRLVLKLILVGAIWVLGPVIDNVVEPKFRKLAPAAGEAASPEFIRIQMLFLGACFFPINFIS